MQALHEKYGDQGLIVVGIHYNAMGDPAAYMKERGYAYRSMVDGLAVAKKYGVSKIPTIMIISRDGRVVHRQIGFAESDVATIRRLFGESWREAFQRNSSRWDFRRREKRHVAGQFLAPDRVNIAFVATDSGIAGRKATGAYHATVGGGSAQRCRAGSAAPMPSTKL